MQLTIDALKQAAASDHDALNADLLAFINGHHPQPGLPHHARI
jgi:hypothetical protein